MRDVTAVAVVPGESSKPQRRAMSRSTRWSILWALLATIALVGVAAALGTGAAVAPRAVSAAAAEELAPPETPPYPYAVASRVGPWGFNTRHSTDYIAWRFFQRDVAFSATISGPNGKTGRFGDAGTWAANATVIGFKVDHAPKVGSVAHWAAGEQGASASGHVAYVERVNSDGSVVVSEFDWSVQYGYSQRGQPGTTSVRAPRYIHIQDR